MCGQALYIFFLIHFLSNVLVTAKNFIIFRTSTTTHKHKRGTCGSQILALHRQRWPKFIIMCFSYNIFFFFIIYEHIRMRACERGWKFHPLTTSPHHLKKCVQDFFIIFILLYVCLYIFFFIVKGALLLSDERKKNTYEK